MGYETTSSIEAEERLASLWSQEFKMRCEQTPLYWPFDFLAKFGGRTYAVECRQRNNPSNKYPTLAYSARKWDSLVFTKRHLASKVFLVAGWTDCWGWVEVGDQTYKVAFGGRSLSTMRSENDREWMLEIPIKDFTMRKFDASHPYAVSQPIPASQPYGVSQPYAEAKAIAVKAVQNTWTKTNPTAQAVVTFCSDK